MSEEHQRRGRPLAPSELTYLEKLQSLVDPSLSIKELDSYAKWIFTTTAVVGVLGAAFSNAAFGSLEGAGKVAFGLAVLFLSASLAVGALSLGPHPNDLSVTLASRESILVALGQKIKRKRKLLTTAATLLAVALLLAGVSPLASAMRVGPFADSAGVMITYTLGRTGVLSATATGVGIPAGAHLDLTITVTGQYRHTPRARGKPDRNGRVDVTVIDSLTGDWQSANIVAKWLGPDNRVRTTTAQLPRH